jgi:hypothetical protein
MANGAYMGHGETYLDAHDILWWSKAPPRIPIPSARGSRQGYWQHSAL